MMMSTMTKCCSNSDDNDVYSHAYGYAYDHAYGHDDDGREMHDDDDDGDDYVENYTANRLNPKIQMNRTGFDGNGGVIFS